MKLTMKTLSAGIFAASLALTTPLFADDAQRPEKVTDSAASISSSVQKLQAATKKMQTQLDHIVQAKTEEERHKAMAEHMQTLQESMQLTRAMHQDSGACPMMGDGMAGGMGMKGGMMGTGGGMQGGTMGMGRGMQGGMQDCPMMGSGMASGAKACGCGGMGTGMGSGMKGGMMGGNQPGTVTPERMQMMEKRMDMMQKMMEQQRATGSTAK